MRKAGKALAALFLAASVLTGNVAAEQTTEDSSITKSKTAEGLNEQYETNVTLSVGGEQDLTASDVVFILDKSTSVDVKEEALKMLNELKSRSGKNKIKAGAIIFNRGVSNTVELGLLDDAKYNEIATLMGQEVSGGTNIELAINTAVSMLDADSEVVSSAKHLVLVTDGVTYLWGQSENGNPYSIYTYGGTGSEENLYAGIEPGHWTETGIQALNSGTVSDLNAWMEANKASVEASLQKQQEYTLAMFRKVAPEKEVSYGLFYEGTEYTFPSAEINSLLPEGVTPLPTAYALTNEASCNEVAVYKTIEAWRNAAAKGYSLYAYASDKYLYGDYPFGYHFVSNLSQIGGVSGAIPSDVTGMFDEVKSEIIYTLAEGSKVKDVIGNAFDLIDDASKLTLNVDGTIYEAEKTATVQGATSSYSFNGGAYVVDYYQNGLADDAREQFVWTFNTDVIKGSNVKLTYGVKLTNPKTEAGTYTENTNEEAEVCPVSGACEVFAKPTVSYTVNSVEESQPDPKPQPETQQEPTLSFEVVNTGVKD